ncbi:hypothetical protein [Bacteroides sp.]|uniref:hypothetical protein n=1 Tax=Bacteroides sp. TaxID=29523 RepID=UPI00263785FD|nr:hypothetical protein [Bacteroides sp.]
MKTLDDEILFIFRLIKRQSYFQKLKVLNSLSEKQNYILTEDLVLFLTQTDDTNEIQCNLRLKIDDIYGTLYTDDFLFILKHNAVLYILKLKDHELYYWEPKKDSIYTSLMGWECKTRIGTLWLKLLKGIKILFGL